MKIVTINGQNHKGSSYTMGRMFAEQLAEPEDITEFFLPKDMPHFCLGCYKCIEDETACPFWQQKKVILDALEQADVFVFTTPNYCMAPSAPMKSLLDFLFDCWMVHRPKEWMFFKRAAIFSTSAGAGCAQPIKVINDSLTYWGVPQVISYGLPVHAKNWQEVDQKTKQKITKKIAKMAKRYQTEKPPKVGFKTKALFGFMGFLHKKGWDSSPAEQSYWQERGWLNGKKPWNR